MPKPRARKPAAKPQPRRAPFAAIFALSVGVIAFAAFIVLDRKMAPPFPKFATNIVSTNIVTQTNAPAVENTNAAASGFSTDLFKEPESAQTTGDTNEIAITEADPSEIVAKMVTEGNKALEAGNAEVAVEKYRKAVEAQPEDEDAHFNLGIALAKTGKTAEARKEYEKALELFPDYTEVHNNLGNLLMNEKDFQGAIEHFKKAMATTPENPTSHNNMGAALARQGNVTEAINHFSEAIRLKPDYLQARINLANAYLTLNRLDDSARELSEALKVDPNYQPAQRALANLRRRLPAKP